MSFPVRSVVTGDLGELAIELAQRLLEQGDDVILLGETLPPEAEQRAAVVRHHRFTFVRTALRERTEALAELAGIDRVFLVSGARRLPVSAEGALERLDGVVRRTINVLDGCLEAGATLVVVTPPGADVPEDPRSYRSGTALQRFAASSVRRYHEKYGLAVATVTLPELSACTGVGCLGTLLPLFVQRALRHEDILLPGHATQPVCFSCLHDVVPVIVAVAERGEAAATPYLITEEQTSVIALAQRVVAYTGSRSTIVFGGEGADTVVTSIERQPDVDEFLPRTAVDAFIQATLFDIRVKPLLHRSA